MILDCPLLKRPVDCSDNKIIPCTCSYRILIVGDLIPIFPPGGEALNFLCFKSPPMPHLSHTGGTGTLQ